MMSHPVLVRLDAISKSYPGVQALKAVSLTIRAGEIHCLVGENGAGKSTLMRILAGAARADSGTIEVNGQGFNALDPAAGLALGIGIIYQELDLVPAMTVAENIFLGHEPGRAGVLNRRALAERSRAILSNFDLPISPQATVRTLGPAERQLVQIAKALSHDNRVLVLDEPTATLTDHEVERLFVLLDRFRRQGMGLVYISHRLEEVLRMGDVVTVLRDGEHVSTQPVAGLTKSDLIEAMVGRQLSETERRAGCAGATVALAVEGLTRRGEFEDISFSLREGEILGLAGLIGAGRSELLETLFGLRRADRGVLRVRGSAVSIRSPRDAIGLGLGLVPEERRESGVILERSVAENLSIAVLRRLSGVFGLRRGALAELARTQARNLGIKAAGLDVPVAQLSGGNQQKVVIGKWLAADVKILLLDEPTRGVDVNAKAEIYRLITQLAAQGMAVLVASSELPEILSITDRIIVLARGRQAAELETARTTQVEIMHHAVAAAAGGTA
jgi:ABC-type sugar transport system ATPase subunit